MIYEEPTTPKLEGSKFQREQTSYKALRWKGLEGLKSRRPGWTMVSEG